MEGRLRDWSAGRSDELALADIGIVGSVRKKLEELRAAGMIDAGFFEESLAKFERLGISKDLEVMGRNPDDLIGALGRTAPG